MNFIIPPQYTGLLSALPEAAKQFANEINMDLRDCHITLIEAATYRNTPCHSIWFHNWDGNHEIIGITPSRCPRLQVACCATEGYLKDN